MNNGKGSVSVKIGGVGGFLLAVFIIALTVVALVFGGAVLVVLIVGMVVIAALAAVADGVSNLWFRATHRGMTRYEVARQVRDERAARARLTENERADADLKAWMLKNNLPV